MTKKYQVYISSTIEDLKEERQRAINTLVLNNFIPAGMDFFHGSDDKWSAIQNCMKESDIYLMIIGNKYGVVNPETKKSYMEMEYDYANELKMPIIIITISDEMTNVKRKADPSIDYYEFDYSTEFYLFKSKLNGRRMKEVNDLFELETILLSELQHLVVDNEKKMRGWVRAVNKNEVLLLKTSSIRDIKKSFSILTELILKKNYKNIEVLGYHKAISKQLLNAISGEELLEYENRLIQIQQIQKGRIRVTISTICKYTQLKNRHFGIDFHASEEQANSYKLKSFKINSHDYTNEMNIIKEKEDRLQFPYRIYSSNLINKIKAPAEISIDHSYECSIFGFFHSHYLHCPCGLLSVTIQLDDKLKKDYSVISSVSSPYTANTGDSVKAKDVIDRNAIYIKLPSWSPRGSGYSISLIKK